MAQKQGCFELVRSDVQKWCNDYKIPKDHGFCHYDMVAHHALSAAQAYSTTCRLEADEVTAIQLAALLHDVDDPKIASFVRNGTDFKSTTPFPIARWFLMRHKITPSMSDLVVEMIGYVSTSKNGDMIPESVKTQMWKLIPRAADRLTAIGSIGVRRCQEVTFRIRNPIVTPSTPLPITDVELDAILAKRSLDHYNGNSASMIDHYFDKLLLLKCPLPDNSYLVEQWQKRMDFMRQWLLRFCSALRMIVITAPLYPTETISYLDCK